MTGIVAMQGINRHSHVAVPSTLLREIHNDQTRITGLRELEEWVLSGAEYPSLIVREAVRDSHDGDLIKDIAALANTAVKNQRFVVFDVSKVTNGVALCELTEADHAQGARYERVTAKYFEPQLRLKYIRGRVRSKSLGVLLIDNCRDGPYLIRKDALPFAQIGDAWIRRRQRTVRMRRSELDKIYSARFAGPLYDGHVRVQFAGNTPSEFIRLKTTDTKQLPSRIAANKIAALIGARETALRSATNEMTYIGRLSQARIMGCDSAYDDKGINTLKLELNSIAESSEKRTRVIEWNSRLTRSIYSWR